MGSNTTVRIMIMIACFIFAGLQGIKVAQGNYTWLEVFFLIAFLGIGMLYLFYYLKGRRGKKE